MPSHPRRNILWIDAIANLKTTSCRPGLRRLLQLARESGFTTVVVDVKPTSGEVLYASRLAPGLRAWSEDRVVPEGYDLLAEAVELAGRTGLELFAGLNVFVEGYVQDGRMRGAVATGPVRPEWESVAYRPPQTVGRSAGARRRNGRTGPITSFPGQPWVFVNPAIPAVQEYEAAVIEEVVRRYPVAGVILDRARYAGLLTDFGSLTRAEIERCAVAPIEPWPQAVLEYVAPGAPGAIEATTGEAFIPGPAFGAWLAFRARTIRDFMAAARERVRRGRPEALFGVYAGSWYPVYHEVGANWAHPACETALERVDAAIRPHLPATYAATGYGDLLDLFLSGSYFPEIETGEAAEPWRTVRGSARLVAELTRGAGGPVYGSLYLEQYRGRPDRAKRAISACLEESDGVMVFDASHLESFGWWSAVREVLA